MAVRTVKVSNVSLSASRRDIQEFFSFSGEIEYVEMQSDSAVSQIAYVTFRDTQGAETAILLSGATIVDLAVTITPAVDYYPPPGAIRHTPPNGERPPADSVVRKAEDVVATMVAKGFVLSKDALSAARSFDERHQLFSSATATVATLDRQLGLSDKFSAGRDIIGSKVKEVDERFQVTELSKSALAAAEQGVTAAGSVIVNMPILSRGASWLSSALGMVTKAAEDMTTMTKEKLEKAEEERAAAAWREKHEMMSEYAALHLDSPSTGEHAMIAAESADELQLRSM